MPLISAQAAQLLSETCRGNVEERAILNESLHPINFCFSFKTGKGKL
jgi:hypothetical protein